MGTFFPASLSNLHLRRHTKRLRASSYDTTGGNKDHWVIAPGETRVLADLTGPGCVNHIWFTLMNTQNEPHFLRKVMLRAYWDKETLPSLEVPVGDFFGMGHAMTKNFVSEPLQMSPEDGRGFNCWFPMPFHAAARFEVTNEGKHPLLLYFYIDYERCEALPQDTLYFHAQWRRECPTDGIDDTSVDNHHFAGGGCNTTGDGNYVILEAEGTGHYVGCNINIHNLRESNKWDWPGEGDDMIFVDGEAWPPNLHGTGTEDYVNMAWSPKQEYSAPYHGIILGGDTNWKGKITYYRYHVRDPITFEQSIRVTVEHGHNNHRSDDWCTTAYWYQMEPHKPFAPMAPVEKRLPVDIEKFHWDGQIMTEEVSP
ncbi:MAG: DUF2961 domain-containing protein [Clostridia bacterium]|nr:DUF2961 domain-containing protein [Clostridia bacterium]